MYRFLIKLMTFKCGIMLTCVTTDSEVHFFCKASQQWMPCSETDRHTEGGRPRRKLGTEEGGEWEGKRGRGKTRGIKDEYLWNQYGTYLIYSKKKLTREINHNLVSSSVVPYHMFSICWESEGLRGGTWWYEVTKSFLQMFLKHYC